MAAMEAAVEELKNNIRESARRAEKQIDARAAEVSQSLQQLEAAKRDLEMEKRKLEEERATLVSMEEYFQQQQEEMEALRDEVTKLRRAGGLFGCCMAPSIQDRPEEPSGS
ncbi:unnamed protein product [Durusdinium trenchii]|uniref:Uncharacterized protein n=2 Tax=Durusdinium trenchii TaxID=1381693 RepID=A0ABP0PMF8_9DINO